MRIDHDIMEESLDTVVEHISNLNWTYKIRALVYLIGDVIKRDIENELIEGEGQILTTEEYVKESCDGIKNEIDSPIFMENVISLVSDWREQNKL